MAQVKKPNFQGTEGQWVGYQGNNFLYTKGKWIQTDDEMNPITADAISNQLDSGFWTAVVNQGGGLLGGLLGNKQPGQDYPDASIDAPERKTATNPLIYVGIVAVVLIAIVFLFKGKKSPEA